MNKLIHTAPPSALGCWLGRSISWTLACAAVFVPISYWSGSVSRIGKGNQIVLLVLLTAIQALAWNRGIAGFHRAFHSGYSPTSLWLKSIALSWLTVLLFILIMAMLLCVFGWLVLSTSRTSANPYPFSYYI